MLSAKTVAKCIVETMLRYGLADQIITDQGSNFQSELEMLIDIHGKVKLRFNLLASQNYKSI